MDRASADAAMQALFSGGSAALSAVLPYLASASSQLDRILSPSAVSAVEKMITSHVGAKLGAAAAGSLASASVLAGAAGVIYVAVRAAKYRGGASVKTPEEAADAGAALQWALAGLLADASPAVVAAAFAAASGSGASASAGGDARLRPFVAPLPRSVLHGEAPSGGRQATVSALVSCACGKLGCALAIRAGVEAGQGGQLFASLRAHASPGVLGGVPLLSAPASCVRVSLSGPRSTEGRDVSLGPTETTASGGGSSAALGRSTVGGGGSGGSVTFRPMVCTSCGHAPLVLIEGVGGGGGPTYAVDASRARGWKVEHDTNGAGQGVLVLVVQGWDGRRIGPGGESGRLAPLRDSLPPSWEAAPWRSRAPADSQPAPPAAPRSPGTSAASALRAAALTREVTGEGRLRKAAAVVAPPPLAPRGGLFTPAKRTEAAAAAVPLFPAPPAAVAAGGAGSDHAGQGRPPARPAPPAASWPARGVYKAPGGPVTVMIDIVDPALRRGPGGSGPGAGVGVRGRSLPPLVAPGAMSLAERAPLRLSGKGPQVHITLGHPVDMKRWAEPAVVMAAAGAPPASLVGGAAGSPPRPAPTLLTQLFGIPTGWGLVGAGRKELPAGRAGGQGAAPAPSRAAPAAVDAEAVSPTVYSPPVMMGLGRGIVYGADWTGNRLGGDWRWNNLAGPASGAGAGQRLGARAASMGAGAHVAVAVRRRDPAGFLAELGPLSPFPPALEGAEGGFGSGGQAGGVADVPLSPALDAAEGGGALSSSGFMPVAALNFDLPQPLPRAESGSGRVGLGHAALLPASPASPVAPPAADPPAAARLPEQRLLVLPSLTEAAALPAPAVAAAVGGESAPSPALSSAGASHGRSKPPRPSAPGPGPAADRVAAVAAPSAALPDLGFMAPTQARAVVALPAAPVAAAPEVAAPAPQPAVEATALPAPVLKQAPPSLGAPVAPASHSGPVSAFTAAALLRAAGSPLPARRLKSERARGALAPLRSLMATPMPAPVAVAAAPPAAVAPVALAPAEAAPVEVAAPIAPSPVRVRAASPVAFRSPGDARSPARLTRLPSAGSPSSLRGGGEASVVEAASLPRPSPRSSMRKAVGAAPEMMRVTAAAAGDQSAVRSLDTHLASAAGGAGGARAARAAFGAKSINAVAASAAKPMARGAAARGPVAIYSGLG